MSVLPNNFSDIAVNFVEVRAVASAHIRNSVHEALALSIREDRKVKLIFNDQTIDIDGEAIILGILRGRIRPSESAKLAEPAETGAEPGAILEPLAEVRELLGKIKNTAPKQCELSMRVVSLGLRSRSLTALAANKISTVGQLIKLTSENIMGWRGVGPGTLQDIRDRLAAVGRTLADENKPKDPS